MPLTATTRAVAQRAPPPRASASPAATAPLAASSRSGGPHVGAGVRLGVEAAVGRVLVLRLAARAHREAGHRRARPVVGDAAHDREARAAVGAVDERVAVAAVGGVEQLAQAVVAGGGVGRDSAAGSPPRALARIAKPRSPVGGDVARRHRARPPRAAAPRAASRRRKPSTARRAPSTSTSTPRSSLSTKPASSSSGASRYTNGRKPTPWTVPSTRARRTRLTARQLDQLPQHVVRARLGLLDPRDVLGARDDHVVGEPVGRDPPAVVADHGDRHQPALARLDQRGDHARASCRWSRARSARRPAPP